MLLDRESGATIRRREASVKTDTSPEKHAFDASGQSPD